MDGAGTTGQKSPMVVTALNLLKILISAGIYHHLFCILKLHTGQKSLCECCGKDTVHPGGYGIFATISMKTSKHNHFPARFSIKIQNLAPSFQPCGHSCLQGLVERLNHSKKKAEPQLALPAMILGIIGL